MPNSNEKGALPSLSSSSASPCPTFSRIRKVCICAGEDHDIVFFKAGDLDFFHKPVPRREDFLAEGCLVRTQMSKDPLLCVRLDSCRISVKVHNHKPPRVWSEVSAYVFTCRSRILQMVVDIAHDRHVDGTLQRRPLAKLVTMKGVSSVSCDDFNILQLLVLNASPHPRSEIRRKLRGRGGGLQAPGASDAETAARAKKTEHPTSHAITFPSGTRLLSGASMSPVPAPMSATMDASLKAVWSRSICTMPSKFFAMSRNSTSSNFPFSPANLARMASAVVSSSEMKSALSPFGYACLSKLTSASSSSSSAAAAATAVPSPTPPSCST
mmetsp:Transcript_20098/g.58778  ORF Transcript_20098/g.58778 Transcript_20098/m.58778 type:complete len:326 (-) Transcript_20098:171-1148(-)